MNGPARSRKHVKLGGVLGIALAVYALGPGVPGAGDAKSAKRGDKVAFTRGDIWVLTSGATRPERVTSSGQAHSPAWSPDGRRLACVSNGGLWLIDLATGARTRLYAGTDSSGPTWSPDGKTIAFGRFGTEEQTGKGSEEGIWAIDRGGTNLRRLLSYAAPEATQSVRGDLWAEWRPHLLDHFAFSPDGRLLAFAFEGESPVLFVATLDQRAPPTRARVIARSEVAATDFCWLGDSQHLLVADGGSEGYAGSGLNIIEAATGGKGELLLPYRFGIHQVAYSASARMGLFNRPDGDQYTDDPRWTGDDVCLIKYVDALSGSRGSAPPSATGIVDVCRFGGQNVVDLQLASKGQTLYVLAEDESRHLYRVIRGGRKTLLSDKVQDFAVWPNG